jgi:hypothetical protein
VQTHFQLQNSPAGASAPVRRSRPSGFRTAWTAVLIGLALHSLGVRNCGGAEPTKEYQIKAAFLYNFTKFVEWPAERFADESAPFVIGVFGKSPIGAELQNIVKGRKVNGREIQIKQVDSTGEAAGCQLLYFSPAADGSVAEALGAIKTAGVLTVGDTERFIRAGGTINFVLEGDKVRFEINTAAAETAGLKISAQLQKLAKTIRKQT